MAISRLDDFEDDTIVLHFGGAAGSIDAYTLAEALIGFADMARAISATIDPGTEIEILVEATGPGSYRTRIRRIKKDYGGLLGVGGAVFWGIVANYIYDNYVKNDPPPQVTVNADGTIVKTGKYTIDISPQVQTGTEHAKQNPPCIAASQKRSLRSKLTRTLRTSASPDQSTISNRSSRSPALNFRRLRSARSRPMKYPSPVRQRSERVCSS